MKNELHFKRFSASMLILAIPAHSWAYDFEVDGIYYNISGSNATVTYEYLGYKGYSGAVTIPSTVSYNKVTYNVTSIGNDAFAECSGLTSVIIPESVMNIGSSAFYGCSGLTSIDIPNGVTNIGFEAFYQCSGLTSIDIPSSVTSIGGQTFYNCFNLTSINIPNSVMSIGDGAFSGCSGLVSISVAPDNTQYDSRNGSNAIIETSTNTLVAGCKNTVIPYSVTNIGGGAFSGCTGLTSVTISNNVTSIGELAFSGCSGIKSIAIPESVTSIGWYAFSGCSSLTSINVASENSEYDSRNNCNAIIETESNILIAGCENTTIPESVTSIGGYAFYGRSGLTSIIIPENVTSIGEYAFYGCSGLTSIAIPESVTSIRGWVFASCSGLSSIIVAPGNPNYNSRNNCNAIIETATNTLVAGCKNTVIPENVTSISNNAFYGCSGLTSIIIPNSVTSIGEYAFCGCSGLTSATIGNGVTSTIGYNAFSDCSVLTSVTCLAESVPRTYSDIFSGIPKSSATLYVPKNSVFFYSATFPWSSFGTILPIDPSAVDELMASEAKADKNAPIFDLNGRRLQQKPASGYYIQGGKKYFVK